MKREFFDLDEFQVSSLVSAFRVKTSMISFWMHVVKLVTVYVPPPEEQVAGKIMICVDKMQRVFVQAGDKVFTASFPFIVKEVDGGWSCGLKSGIEVNSKVSSEVLAVLSATHSFENVELFGFADDIMQVSDDPDTLWRVLSELVRADDGYVRLDHDPVREDGDLHPLNHLDVFYSQAATFKIGLKDKIEIDDLADVLNLKSDCHFLQKNG